MEGKTRQRGTDERHRADDILPESEARLDVSGSTELAEVSPNRLELFFSQSLDGFFFMMLDEPVQWDDTVDKDKVLDYVFAHQRITKVNDAMLAQYGATAEEFLGLTPNDFYAHDLAYGKKVWCEFFDAGRLHVETDERKFDSTPMSIEGDYICFYDAEGRITGHFGIQRDVTERKRAEQALRQYNQRLKILQEIDRAILAARSPEEIAQAAVRHIHELVPCLRASVAVFDFTVNKAVLIAIHATTKTKPDVGAEFPLEAFGDIGQLRLGKICAVEDMETLSPQSGAVAAVQAEGVRSFINVPLRAQGKLIGALNLGAERPGRFSGEHIEIAQEAADSLAIAIQQARLREEIERHAAGLEQRVTERTAELSAANAGLKNEIAERERIEAVLRENEERYRSLYNNTPVMLHSIDGEKKLISVNDFWLKTMGYERHEVIGRTVSDFLTEASRRFALEVGIPQLFRSGSLQDAEVQFVKKNGEVIDVLVSALLKRDERGKLLWTQAFLLDVTERKRAERALHHRLAIEQMISEISTYFINLGTEEAGGGIDYALQRLGGWEGVDRSYLFLLFDEGKRAVNTHEWCAAGVTPQMQNLQHLAFNELPWASRKTMQKEILYVPHVADLPAEAQFEKSHWQEQGIQSLLTVPVMWSGKVRGFIGFDSVRAEKRWQEEDIRLLNIVSEVIAGSLHRQEVAAALRASEERLKRIFESAMDAIITVDETMRVVMCNEAAEKIFRCQAAEVKDKMLEGFLSENFRALLANYIHASAAQALPQYIWAPEGLTARRKSGESFPVEATISRVEMAHQNLFTIILRDINERKKAEEELARLQNQNVYLREEALKSEYNFGEIIGASTVMQQVFKNINMVAATDATVLLLGETGTGKELIARTIHNRSGRKDHIMVKVNCGALPAGLVESELFGHEKGAFTGATAQKKGRFELAHRGTFFLDEVGELSLETQVKLLRVLQEQEIERVGGTQTLKVNVRVIAATNRNLQDEVQRGVFRADLFYRLNIFPIQIPPLRERQADLPLLANYFVREFARRLGKRINRINQNALEKLAGYEWPGNVRELANILERAVILCQGRVLQEEHIGIFPTATLATEKFETLEEAERRHILQALDKTGGVLAGPKGAAQLLGINRSTLWSRMRKLGIETGSREQ